VDSKAECDQLNLAQVARKNMKKKKLKQTNASAHQWFHPDWLHDRSCAHSYSFQTDFMDCTVL